MRRKWVGGNWKMNGSRQMVAEVAGAIAGAQFGEVDVALFPPYPYLREVCAATAASRVAVGGQDASEHEFGAYTGESRPRCCAMSAARWRWRAIRSAGNTITNPTTRWRPRSPRSSPAN